MDRLGVTCDVRDHLGVVGGIHRDLVTPVEGIVALLHERADVAARLFAERGYEHVVVSDVAREAEVSDQTVYNYFQTRSSWSSTAISTFRTGWSI